MKKDRMDEGPRGRGSGRLGAWAAVAAGLLVLIGLGAWLATRPSEPARAAAGDAPTDYLAKIDTELDELEASVATADGWVHGGREVGQEVGWPETGSESRGLGGLEAEVRALERGLGVSEGAAESRSFAARSWRERLPEGGADGGGFEVPLLPGLVGDREF